MDDGSPVGYCIAILLLIAGGAFFAAAETAYASVNRIRMVSYSGNGDRRARRVLYILDHFDKALTTILIGNNVMHIGCAAVATLMATRLWGVGAVTGMTLVTSFLLFLIAETLPKRSAIAASEQLALRFSWSMLILMKALTPVTFLFTSISRFAARPFEKKHAEEPTVTEDEFHDLLDTAAEEGAIDEEKSELVQNALDFSETYARDVLTPWEKTVYLTTSMDRTQIMDTIREGNHSRMPVVDARGYVIGILSIRKYLKACLKGDGRPRLRSVMDPVVFVEPEMPIDDILPYMSSRRTQTAIVGEPLEKPLGILSVEDILEELVGEIHDENETDASSPEERGGEEAEA